MKSLFGRPGQRGPLAFITLTILLDAMGIGIIIPVMPGLISDLSHLPIEKAASVGGALVMTYALAQFLFSPVIGGLSDAYGRRPVLLFSMSGFAINMLVSGLTPVLWLLFVSRFFAGAAGASYSTAYAYIADVTDPHDRASTYGLMGVAFGLGFILGPAIGGFAGDFSVRAPFFVAAALAGLNIIMGLTVLPESLPPERRRPFDIRRANAIGSIRQLIRLGGSLQRLALVYFLWMLAMQAMHGVWPFVAEYRYRWSAAEVGLSLAVMGVLSIIVNGVLVRRSVKILGEFKTALMGLAGGAIGYVAQFFADTGSLAYVAISIGSLGGLVVPPLQAMMTERTPPAAQGELQGALATLSSLTVIIGPIVFANLFTWFTSASAPVRSPGAPFLLSALLAGAAFAILALARQRAAARL